MKILVIEDSRLLRLALSRMLGKAGHEVIAAGDGQEGLRRAQQIHPDMILLDMMLPSLEGTGVLRLLKQGAVTKNIPVVVLSGLSQKNEQKLKESGAAGYIEKSILDLNGDGAPLLSALNELMKEVTVGHEEMRMATAARAARRG
ncbi:MAG: response regulator [Candidatus Sulfotelmatobacter sp.]